MRVRNLSETGALIEAASLPPIGSAITLRRGELEARGTIVWVASGKAGLTFSGAVDVSAWLPTSAAKRSIAINPIAAEVHRARAVQPGSSRAADGDPMTRDAIIADLAAIQAQLGQLVGTLVPDAALLAKHPDIQLLDVAGQRIARIVAALQKGA